MNHAPYKALKYSFDILLIEWPFDRAKPNELGVFNA